MSSGPLLICACAAYGGYKHKRCQPPQPQGPAAKTPSLRFLTLKKKISTIPSSPTFLLHRPQRPAAAPQRQRAIWKFEEATTATGRRRLSAADGREAAWRLLQARPTRRWYVSLPIPNPLARIVSIPTEFLFPQSRVLKKLRITVDAGRSFQFYRSLWALVRAQD